jgi:hypothetical protein
MYAWRKIVSIVAVVGVLLHATAIARHNAISLESSLDAVARAAALGDICDGAADGQDKSSGKSQNSRCPICAGLAGTLLVPSAPDLHVPNVFFVKVDVFTAADSDVREIFLSRPPGRGPPLDA